MVGLNQEKGRYRVLLIGIGGNTEEEKDSFCRSLYKNYNIPFLLLKKIVNRCPIVLKKNLSLEKAELLAKNLKFFGATVSVEEKRNFPPITLEFQELVPHQLALESSHLRKTQRGTWNVIGRAKNISDEALNDTWVLIQLFDDLEGFITFEETPLPINPLPSGEASPFKVVFEGSLSIKKISVAFKKASGQPIAAVDKRKMTEWVGVEIEDERLNFPEFISPAAEEKPASMDLRQPPGEILIAESLDIPKDPLLSSESDSPAPPFEERGQESGENGKEGAEEPPLPLSLEESFSEMTCEPLETVSESSPSSREEKGYQGEKESDGVFEHEPFQESGSCLREEIEEEEVEAALEESELPSGNEEPPEELGLDTSAFEKATQLLEDISKRPGEGEADEETEEREGPVKEEALGQENLPSFPWIEHFRDAVGNFYKKPRDTFSIWFEECRKEGGFGSSLHAVLTILIHARFNQGNQSMKALENTRRVSQLVVQPNLLIDEIPSLEGTPFVCGEIWKELFHRALPKIHQIGDAILEKNKWDAFDLERLIQVIPHMDHQNSRMAARWIKDLIPDVVEIDFSLTPVIIGEGLYRVSSRLDIVDPHFDYYRGRNSTGDIKIQSFAKMAFPQNPVEVEEPMAWTGTGEERGGHCFPVQPRCEGCLFENFCPKLYLHFNPSEKGMRE